jgi:hypothetical protein
MNLISLFSRKIVSLITKNKNITQDDLEVYIYGTELFDGICFQVNLIIEIALATIIIVLAPVDSVNNSMDLNTKK